MTQTIARTNTAPNAANVAPTQPPSCGAAPWHLHCSRDGDNDPGVRVHDGQAAHIGNVEVILTELTGPGETTGPETYLNVPTMGARLNAADTAALVLALMRNLRIMNRTVAVETVAQLIRDGGQV